MADYFGHWLAIGRTPGAKLPRIFYVNWFRKDQDGKFIWPGYGENSRVLAWIVGRVTGERPAQDTPIGLVPPLGAGGIDSDGLGIGEEQMSKLLEVDRDGWIAQLPQIKEHYAEFGDRLPDELRGQLQELERRLKD
jgi:phosphoenolpyruvate carboxykinase (GTP)